MEAVLKIVTYSYATYTVTVTPLLQLRHCHKKRKDSLEGRLNWVLFVADLEFSKVLVSRLPQNSSNVNIELIIVLELC